MFNFYPATNSINIVWDSITELEFGYEILPSTAYFKYYNSKNY